MDGMPIIVARPRGSLKLNAMTEHAAGAHLTVVVGARDCAMPVAACRIIMNSNRNITHRIVARIASRDLRASLFGRGNLALASAYAAMAPVSPQGRQSEREP